LIAVKPKASEKKSKKVVEAPKKSKKEAKKVVVESDSDDSSSEVPAPKKKAAEPKKKAIVQDSSSDDSDSESSVKPVAKKAKAAPVKKESSSDDDSSESEKPAPKKAKAAKKDSSSSEDEEASRIKEEEAARAKEEPVAAAVASNVNPDDVGKTELFVSNFSMNTWEESIREHFEVYGNLIKCKHFINKQMAFIQYATHEESAKAQAATHNSTLDGSVLMVKFSGDKPSAPGGYQTAATGEADTIFCGNLYPYCNEETIRDFFSAAGEVSNVRLAMDAETNRCKGFCHVKFASPADAAKAV